MVRTLSGLVLALLVPAVATAQTQNGSGASGATAEGRRTAQAPTVDGVLDDAGWAAAQPLRGFVQREPAEGRAASEETEVRILFDDEALYLGAWMFDSDPDGIVYGETRRDASLDDNDALLFILDTYQDRQNGFVFGTTPAGIEYDGQVTREGQGGGGGPRRQQTGSGGGFNLNWDGSWEVATTRDERGWYAEFRIPFSTLRYGRGGDQEWGLNVARRIRRKNEEVFWSPIRRQFNLYRVSDAGTLVGLAAPARRVLQVTPYALAGAQRDYNALPLETDTEGDVGGDVKFGVTPSLTLDLTYNTDFAQVEVDEQQVNLTRFSLFFPEKRPFFLENAGTFSVGSPQSVELFFSRRIGIDGGSGSAVPIIGGGRLSGRAAGLTVGFLNIQTDEVVGVTDPNNFSAARVMKELPNRTRIGAIFVNRLNTDDADDYNVTVGVDGRLGIGDAVTFEGYAAKTETPGLGTDDIAFNGSGSLTTRDWSAAIGYRRVGEDFNPEVGFLERNAFQMFNARVLRKFRFPEFPWFRELRPHISWREFFDLDGFSETRLIHIDSHFEFSNGAFFQLPAVNLTREGLRDNFEIAPGIVVPPGTYDNFEWGFAYNTNESAPLSLAGRIDIGGFYSGTRKATTANLNARFGQTFVAGVRLGYSNVDLREGSFETTLIGLRVAYSFTPRIYLQSLVQYNDQSDAFSSNVRFGWLNTAGTGLFVVFNDIEAVIDDRFTPDTRAFIVKFTQQFNITN